MYYSWRAEQSERGRVRVSPKGISAALPPHSINSARDDGRMMDGRMLFAVADEGFSFLFPCFYPDYVLFPLLPVDDDDLAQSYTLCLPSE